MYEQGGRDDMVATEKEELAVIMEFLPKQLDDEELKSMIKEVMDEVGASQPSDMGKVMGALKAKTVGRADPKIVSKLVKQALS